MCGGGGGCKYLEYNQAGSALPFLTGLRKSLRCRCTTAKAASVDCQKDAYHKWSVCRKDTGRAPFAFYGLHEFGILLCNKLLAHEQTAVPLVFGTFPPVDVTFATEVHHTFFSLCTVLMAQLEHAGAPKV